MLATKKPAKNATNMNLSTATGRLRRYSKSCKIRNPRHQPSSRQGEDPIECTLRHVSLDENPVYGALSYAWGDAENPARILLNGQDVEVTANLAAALLHLRAAGMRETTLWIDAICIDQANIAEQNDQIRQMASIYELATGVVVWLGRDYGNSRLAMDFVREVLSQENLFEWALDNLSNPGYTGQWAEVLDLFDRRDYWRRSWVVQEYALAQDVIFRCGWYNILNDHIYEFINLFWDDEHGLSEIAAYHDNSFYQFLQGSLVDMLAVCQQRQLPGQRNGFWGLLILNVGREAADPRDKVYGVLGLADDLDDSEFLPDYSLPVRQVHEDVNCSTDLELPSWAPDWRVSIQKPHLAWPIEGAVLVPNKAAALSTAEFSFEGNGSVLVVTGLCVGIVSSVGEVCPTGDQEPDLWTHVQKWMRLANISSDASKPDSPTEKTRVDEFWRTTIANRTKNNFMPPASFSDMFDVWSERTKPPPAPTPDNASTISSYYVALRAAVKDRRFFLSSSSTIGLGPSDLTPGDMVCVLLGCDAPTIIRRAGGHHLFVGETYFHDYMDEEAIWEMNEGKIQLQKFTLY